ncbi:MAG: protein kinase domain-containing protein [Bryobacteraceae bacterium]
MPGLRDAITKTLLHLSRGVQSRPASTTRSTKPPSAADSALRAGRNLGPYRILKHLGAGGMGHVYLALHTRLGRHVALKFLPPDLTADKEMLRRLEEEARTASRLNHPNILTIHDIGQLEGEHYIDSEYVDGATLRSAIERDVIDPATAIDIASQVLSALIAAHSAGVIHRDLKPGNIMIRPDGYIKVIDFGLAKNTRRSSGSTWTDTITRFGSIVGTVDYMSPEQARGDPVDHRTDLWSLGVVLYEMVTNRRPFDGDTENHVIVNILDKPVPQMRDVPDLPVGLSKVIGRALAKNPDERYQTAREMLTDLQAIRRSSHIESNIHKVAIPARPRNWKLLVLSAVLSAGLVALGAAWWFTNGRTQFLEPDWFRVESVRRLTFNGQTVESCLSPDGRYLAFAASDSNGLQTLYLSQLSAASEEVKIPAKKVSYLGITFSPDDELYVVSEGDDFKGKLYRLPLIGSSTGQPIVVDIDGPVSFSPMGDQFAFVRRTSSQRKGRDQNESAVFIASRDGSQIHKLFSTTDWTIMRQIAWSPKGDQIAAVLFNDVSDRNSRLLLDLVGLHGTEHRLPLPDWQKVGRIWWTSDARSIILPAAARTEAPNQGQIHQIALSSLRVQDITKDLAGYRSVSLTKNENQLAAIKQEVKVSIWVSSPGDFSHGQSAMAEAERHSSLAWANEEQLILNSQRSGYPNFWLFNVESQIRTNLTNEPFVEQDALPVPGSRSIVFSSNRTGEYKLWKFDRDTNVYTQLTFGPGYDEAPSITPDGRWIVYTSWSSNNPHLRLVSIEGGASAQVGKFSAKWPQISPDGKLIACLIENPEDFTLTVAVVPFSGSSVIKSIPDVQEPFRWYGSNQTLAAVKNQGASNIWAVPLNGAAFYPITHFADQKILNFAFSLKGDRIACLRGSLESDVNLFTRRTSR